MYLLDTNVVSELRRQRPHGAVVAWLQAVPDDRVHISAITVGELQAGVEITREQDSRRAAIIEAWVDRISETSSVLAMDHRAFRVWAKLMHRQPDYLIEDAMIAATAIVHNLMIATRNVRDFQRLGVATLNPFEAGRA